MVFAIGFHFGVEDLDYSPIDTQGDGRRMYELFGNQMILIIEKMNEALVKKKCCCSIKASI